jgi:hypothetical protein
MVTPKKSYLDDLDDDIVADGQSVRCPIHLMDSVQRAMVAKYSTRLTDDEARLHQPGFRCGNRYQKAYADYCRDAGLPEPDPDAVANQKAPRETYIRGISNAWRNQTCTPWAAAPADLDLAERVASLLALSRPLRASSGPPYTDSRFETGKNQKPMRGNDSVDDPRAAATASYNAMVERLRNAWRTPVGRDAAGPAW